jgi:uncharacterized protein YndB with AHSA1/START domain
MKKTLWIIASLLIAALLAALVLSPYRQHAENQAPSVLNTVVIDAPIDSVYAYLSNSANASRWSVFVDHIVPLNADSVPDGAVGSFRRCFQNADKQGLRWDEEIIIVEPLKQRRLSIFNMVDFPMQAEHLATDQFYEATSNTQTRLTFTVFFLQAPSFWTTLKMKLGAWRIDDIFIQNMNNIKQDIEQKRI